MATRQHWYDLTQPSADVFWHGERPWPATTSDAAERAEQDHWHHGRPAVSMRFFRHEILVALASGGVVVLIALILALTFFHASGGLAVFMAMSVLSAYIALFMAPAWIAAILDDAEAHADELRE